MSFENGYPDVIELVPNAHGGYSPDLNISRETAGAIELYRPPADPVQHIPIPNYVPNYDSGGRSMSDADLADFGVDEYGKPIVDRDSYDKPRWNPDLDLSPETTKAVNEAIGDNPGNRTSRRAAGAALSAGLANGLGPDDVINAAVFTGSIADPIGSAIGTPIGKALRKIFRPNAPQLGAPSGEINTPGAGAHPQGQCETRYRVFWTTSVNDGYGGIATSESTNGYGINGPITNFKIENFANGYRISLTDRTGNYIKVGDDFSDNRQPQARNVRLSREDNQPDACGARLPGLQPVTGTPTKPDTRTPNQPYPPGYPENLTRYPQLPGFNLPGFPDPYNRSLPGYHYPPGHNEPDYDDLPGTRNPPKVNPPTQPPDSPTPENGCCPDTGLSLDAIKKQLEEILNKLQGEGEGLLNLIPCVPPDDISELVTKGTYGGDGLTGIYDAIAAITQSLNLIHTDTKCPPEATAALPMVWELKHGEIPQLLVLWKPKEGGNSRWAMTIPHPKPSLTQKSAFRFPDYMKGTSMAKMKLKDGSTIIVNVSSKSDAALVMNYTYSLLDPAFRPDSIDYSYAENVTSAKKVKVSACYLKRFEGHKTTVPLWIKSL